MSFPSGIDELDKKTRGHLVHMTGLVARPDVQRDADPEQLLVILQKHLKDAFKRIDNVNKCAVLFSGGVDSALAALMTKETCKDTLLITARGEESHDAKVAIRAAKSMNLPLVEIELNSRILWKTLPDLLNAIDSRKRMDVEIALPFFFAAKEAKVRGYELLVSGQGPDELFGGYARYEKMMVDLGSEKVEQALWEDFSITDQANLTRDSQAVKAHGIDVFFPYAYTEFAKTALTIPSSLNIDPSKRPSRKLLFRELAIRIGVPSEVALTPKRATQYSSGSSRLLEQAICDNVDSIRNLPKRERYTAIQDFLDSFA